MQQEETLEEGKRLLKEAAAQNSQKANKAFDFNRGPLGCCTLRKSGGKTSEPGVTEKQCEQIAERIHAQCSFTEGNCP